MSIGADPTAADASESAVESAADSAADSAAAASPASASETMPPLDKLYNLISYCHF